MTPAEIDTGAEIFSPAAAFSKYIIKTVSYTTRRGFFAVMRLDLPSSRALAASTAPRHHTRDGTCTQPCPRPSCP